MTTDTWHHQLNILKLLTHLLKIFWTFWGSSYELCADLDGFANPYRPMGDTGLSIYISPVAGRRNMQECSWHFSLLVTSSWWLLNGVKSSNLSSYQQNQNSEAEQLFSRNPSHLGGVVGTAATARVAETLELRIACSTVSSCGSNAEAFLGTECFDVPWQNSRRFGEFRRCPPGISSIKHWFGW